MSSIVIKRPVGTDRLEEKEWRFGFRSLTVNGMPQIYLDCYFHVKRPTTRHKFNPESQWLRYDRRYANVTFEQATPPEDVVQEALAIARAAVVYNGSLN